MKKVALITGSSRGLGKAMVEAFAEQNYRVVVHYNKSKANAHAIINSLEQKGLEAMAIYAPLDNAQDIQKAISNIIERFGRIDVLVNNAGVKEDASIFDMSLETFTQVMNINVIGAWIMTKHVAEVMKKQGSGRIINISSGVGTYGREFQTNYAGSKGALNAITKSLSKELGPYNITVNAIAPGLIETDMTADVDPEHKEAYRKQIPLQRLGKPKDIANAALFLAGDGADFISGQIIHVNGGLR